MRVGEIPERVAEDCGMLVNPKDIKVLANSVGRLLNDDEMRKRFGLNCRKRVLKNILSKNSEINIPKFIKNIRGGLDHEKSFNHRYYWLRWFLSG